MAQDFPKNVDSDPRGLKKIKNGSVTHSHLVSGIPLVAMQFTREQDSSRPFGGAVKSFGPDVPLYPDSAHHTDDDGSRNFW